MGRLNAALAHGGADRQGDDQQDGEQADHEDQRCEITWLR
jgi:hypothetical protein